MNRREYDLWWRLQAENIRMRVALEKFRDRDNWVTWVTPTQQPIAIDATTYVWIGMGDNPVEIARKAIEG